MFQIGQGLCQNVNENCTCDTRYACGMCNLNIQNTKMKKK